MYHKVCIQPPIGRYFILFPISYDDEQYKTHPPLHTYASISIEQTMEMELMSQILHTDLIPKTTKVLECLTVYKVSVYSACIIKHHLLGDSKRKFQQILKSKLQFNISKVGI
jgi:hypothetical protein